MEFHTWALPVVRHIFFHHYLLQQNFDSILSQHELNITHQCIFRSHIKFNKQSIMFIVLQKLWFSWISIDVVISEPALIISNSATIVRSSAVHTLYELNIALIIKQRFKNRLYQQLFNKYHHISETISLFELNQTQNKKLKRSSRGQVVKNT